MGTRTSAKTNFNFLTHSPNLVEFYDKCLFFVFISTKITLEKMNFLLILRKVGIKIYLALNRFAPCSSED